jgi:hypothetical protein
MSETVSLMSMNGVGGGDAFSMVNHKFNYAIVTGWDSRGCILYTRENGVSGGNIGFGPYQDGGVEVSGITQGYVVGTLSGAHHLIGATHSATLALQDKKDIKNTFLDYITDTIVQGRTLEGLTAMSGASNDFLNLFGITSGSPVYQGNTFGVTCGIGSSGGYSDRYSFIATDNNIQELTNYHNLIMQVGTGGIGSTIEYILPDAGGMPINFSGQDVLNVYQDVMGFRAASNTSTILLQNSINAATDYNSVSSLNLSSNVAATKGQSYSTSQTPESKS